MAAVPTRSQGATSTGKKGNATTRQPTKVCRCTIKLVAIGSQSREAGGKKKNKCFNKIITNSKENTTSLDT